MLDAPLRASTVDPWVNVLDNSQKLLLQNFVTESIDTFKANRQIFAETTSLNCSSSFCHSTVAFANFPRFEISIIFAASGCFSSIDQAKAEVYGKIARIKLSGRSTSYLGAHKCVVECFPRRYRIAGVISPRIFFPLVMLPISDNRILVSFLIDTSNEFLSHALMRRCIDLSKRRLCAFAKKHEIREIVEKLGSRGRAREFRARASLQGLKEAIEACQARRARYFQQALFQLFRRVSSDISLTHEYASMSLLPLMVDGTRESKTSMSLDPPADATDLAMLSELREPSGKVPLNTVKLTEAKAGAVRTLKVCSKLRTMKQTVFAVRRYWLQAKTTPFARQCHPCRKRSDSSSRLLRR